MPIYHVHIYREWRIYYPSIKASSPEEAARIAGDKPTREAHLTEDCEAENIAALVDVDGDDGYEQSEIIDFERGRMNKAAPELLEALDYLLQQTIDQDLKYGIGLSEGEQDARKKALAAIARAKGEKPLPPDPDGQNDDRASWAGEAIKAFQKVTETDDADALSDLLADLIHWADRNNYDFEAALIRGRGHYAEETKEEAA